MEQQPSAGLGEQQPLQQVPGFCGEGPLAKLAGQGRDRAEPLEGAQARCVGITAGAVSEGLADALTGEHMGSNGLCGVAQHGQRSSCDGLAASAGRYMC